MVPPLATSKRPIRCATPRDAAFSMPKQLAFQQARRNGCAVSLTKGLERAGLNREWLAQSVTCRPCLSINQHVEAVGATVSTRWDLRRVALFPHFLRIHSLRIYFQDQFPGRYLSKALEFPKASGISTAIAN